MKIRPSTIGADLVGTVMEIVVIANVEEMKNSATNTMVDISTSIVGTTQMNETSDREESKVKTEAVVEDVVAMITAIEVVATND